VEGLNAYVKAKVFIRCQIFFSKHIFICHEEAACHSHLGLPPSTLACSCSEVCAVGRLLQWRMCSRSA